MAVPLISHPMRLSPNGTMFCRDQSDDEYIAERIALLCTTQPGERILVPGYGIADPVFSGFDENLLRTQLDLYGPHVELSGVNINNVTDSLQNIQVEFTTTTDAENED